MLWARQHPPLHDDDVDNDGLSRRLQESNGPDAGNSAPGRHARGRPKGRRPHPRGCGRDDPTLRHYDFHEFHFFSQMSGVVTAPMAAPATAPMAAPATIDRPPVRAPTAPPATRPMPPPVTARARPSCRHNRQRCRHQHGQRPFRHTGSLQMSKEAARYAPPNTEGDAGRTGKGPPMRFVLNAPGDFEGGNRSRSFMTRR